MKSSSLAILTAAGALAALALGAVPSAYSQDRGESARAPSDAPKAEGISTAPALKPEPFAVEKVIAIDPGIIEGVAVAPGDRVEQGALLVTLDSHRQQHAVDVAKVRANDKSSVKQAAAEVEIQQSIVDELRTRARRRLVSDSALRQAEAKLESQRAKLESARAAQALSELSLEQAQRALSHRFLTSPISGIVVSVHKAKADTVSTGTLLVTVADISQWRMMIPVTEAQARQMFVGMSVPVQVAGHAGQAFGQVLGIRPGEDGQHYLDMAVRNPDPARNIQPPESIQPQLPEDPSGGGVLAGQGAAPPDAKPQ